VLDAQAERISTSALVQVIKQFSRVEADLRGGWQPQLPLELALVEGIVGSAGETMGPPVAAAQTPAVLESPAAFLANPEPVDVTSPQPPVEQAVIGVQNQDAAPEELSLQDVCKHWPQVLENVRARDRSVQALLNSTQPAEVENGTLTLHVAHEFARDKLSQGRARRLVEEVLSQVLGQSCHIEYVVVDSSVDGGPIESNDTWDDDPVVRAARQMGAEVRPIDEGR